jgi:hypothetical protein
MKRRLYRDAFHVADVAVCLLTGAEDKPRYVSKSNAGEHSATR